MQMLLRIMQVPESFILRFFISEIFVIRKLHDLSHIIKEINYIINRLLLLK